MTSKGLQTCLWILLTSVLSRPTCSASHFEGASVSWKAGKFNSTLNATEVLIFFRIAWRRSTAADSPATFCDQDDVSNKKELGDYTGEPNKWACLSGCNDSLTATVICTEFDEVDDWSVGYSGGSVYVKNDSSFELEFFGCCWISTLVYDDAAKWNLTVAGTLGLRSDTGLHNRSPISAASPVIRFQAGCPDSVDLVMYDADHDSILCRFAECSGPKCYGYPYLKLTKQGEHCRLSYNGGGPGNTDVAISIVLEDYPKNNDLVLNGVKQTTGSILSWGALQFIVRVYNDIHACNLRPEWVDPTFSNGFIKTAVVNVTMNINLRVSSAETINVLNVVGPIGISKSALVAEVSGTEYSAILTYTPSYADIGPNMICITAKDLNGKMSVQRCAIVIVGEGTPCSIDNGGCSDQCDATGDSYVCSCTRKCWGLAPDKRTCIPLMQMNCDSDQFDIVLPVCAVGRSPFTIGYNLQASDTDSENCEADLVGTNFTRKILYSDCQTQREEDFLEIHYRNQLRLWVDDDVNLFGSGDAQVPIITRGFWYNIKIVCSFNKYGNVNASFRPQDQQEGSISVPGLGSFQFFFDFYIDKDFQATYSPYEYPITVTVNSDIYFGIRTVGGTGLEVFTEKCVAMTSASLADSKVSYTMIENGCRKDNTLKTHGAPSKMEDRFSIKAFRFQDNLNNTDGAVDIYIQCSAVLCVVGEVTTRCQKGCISTRKRRDENDQVFLDHNIHTRRKRAVDDDQAVSTVPPNITESNILDITVSGPFRIEIEHIAGTPLVTVVTPTNVQSTATTSKRTTKKTVVEDPKQPDSITVVVIASSVGGILFLLLLILLIGLVAYYHFALKPRQKVIPNKEDFPPRSTSAWTVDGGDVYNEGRVYDEIKTPPPSFWDVQHMT